MSLETAHVKGYEFPNAIYIGAIDFNGTIRTGTNVFRSDGFQGGNGHGATKYAYVSTVLLGNLRRVCPGTVKSVTFIDAQFWKDCEYLKSEAKRKPGFISPTDVEGLGYGEIGRLANASYMIFCLY